MIKLKKKKYFLKYMPDNLNRVHQVLCENRVYLSSRDQFNDPFDMVVRFKDSASYSDKIKKEIIEYYRQKAISQGRNVPLDFGDNFFSDNKASQEMEEILQNDINNTGIYCLVDYNDSDIHSYGDMNDILMWSYYNQHKGVCVLFKKPDASNNDLGFHLRTPNSINKISPTVVTVEYKNEIPKLDMHEDRVNDPGGTKILKKVFGRKHTRWTHESESRIVVPDYGNEFAPFDNELIDGVIMGCRVECSFSESVKCICKAYKYSLYRAELHKDEYSLVIRLVYEP